MRLIKTSHIAVIYVKSVKSRGSCPIHIEFNLAGWTQGGWTASGRESQIPYSSQMRVSA
jgi:hypothetical protein